MTIHPPASGSSSQPFAGARHTATARYHHQPVFLFFSFFLLGFFLFYDFFFSPFFFLESRRRRFHITRALTVFYFIFFGSFFLISLPLPSFELGTTHAGPNNNTH
jgi:4-amino-4-deoxy-L-arabinose transferase-like glycosyltransferase